MGHKVNPNGFRLGITTQWTSNWYAERGAYTGSFGSPTTLATR